MIPVGGGGWKSGRRLRVIMPLQRFSIAEEYSPEFQLCLLKSVNYSPGQRKCFWWRHFNFKGVIKT